MKGYILLLCDVHALPIQGNSQWLCGGIGPISYRLSARYVVGFSIVLKLFNFLENHFFSLTSLMIGLSYCYTFFFGVTHMRTK